MGHQTPIQGDQHARLQKGPACSCCTHCCCLRSACMALRRSLRLRTSFWDACSLPRSFSSAAAAAETAWQAASRCILSRSASRWTAASPSFWDAAATCNHKLHIPGAQHALQKTQKAYPNTVKSQFVQLKMRAIGPSPLVQGCRLLCLQSVEHRWSEANLCSRAGCSSRAAPSVLVSRVASASMLPCRTLKIWRLFWRPAAGRAL